MRTLGIAVVAAIGGLSTLIAAQQQPIGSFSAMAQHDYQVVPNLTYVTIGNVDVKLDLYRPNQITDPVPTLIYFHGGGFRPGLGPVTNSKEVRSLAILPYLEMGYSVVNVEYRTTRIALAPAAVEDGRCALRWVFSHAKEYKFDLNRVVISGESVGGYLALITGLAAASADLDGACTAAEPMSVAAIVNWFGFADVAAEIVRSPTGGPSIWIGVRPGQLSPLDNSRENIPTRF